MNVVSAFVQRPLVKLQNIATNLWKKPSRSAQTRSDDADDDDIQMEMDPVESDSLLRNNKCNTNNSTEEEESSSSGMLTTIRQSVVRRVDSIVGTTHDVVEAVEHVIVEEIHIAHEGLMDNLHDAAERTEDGSFFLEMSLTRNLSILPVDKNLVEAVEEVKDFVQHPQSRPSHTTTTTTTTIELPSSAEGDGIDDENDEELGIDRKQSESTITTFVASAATPLIAYLLLASAVVALSSIGPFLNYQRGVQPTMKIFWRMTATVICLAPMAIRSVVYDGIPSLTLTQWCTFGIAAASYALMTVAFVLALDYTSVDNAVILSNSQSLILLAGKLFVGASSIHWLEATGALVAFAGAVMCSRDHSSIVAQATPDDATAGLSALYGDCLALLSAVGGVLYLTFGKSLRTAIEDVYVFMFVNMAMGSFFTLLFMLMTHQDMSFSHDINIGLWGWINVRLDRLPLEIAMVVLCNLLGALGYVRAFAYFSTLVISVAALMEPVVASFLAFEMGVGVLPGALGWMGNAFVATGTLAVIYPTVDKGDVH